MKTYILSIVAAAIVCAVTRSLLNEKSAAGQIVRLLGGLLMTITVIAPLADITFEHITDYFDDLSIETDGYVESGETAAQESMKGIIKSQTEAYILDKANSMGLEIAVEVVLDDSNNSVPCGVKIIGALSPYAKEVMGTYMEDTLGIAKENQQWM